ncbi:MAG: hypothetical protein ACON5B_08950 [Myxococcota bacterium]
MTSRVYRFAPLLLTFALVACDGGSEDTTDDTTDDTTVDTTDTTDTTEPTDTDDTDDTDEPVVPTEPIYDVDTKTHPDFDSLFWVRWMQQENGVAWAEYKLNDEDGWIAMDQEERRSGANRQLVVGVPYGATYEYRVVYDDGKVEAPYGMGTATAPDAPLPLGTPNIELSDPDGWDPDSDYILGSFNTEGTWGDGKFWTFIMDREGNYYWARRSERFNNTTDTFWTIFVRPHWDRDSIIVDEQGGVTFQGDSNDSKLIRMKLDGTVIEEWAAPKMHHAWDYMSEGEIVYGYKYGNSENLTVINPDRSTYVLWDCTDDWLALNGQSGSYCRSNTVNYDEATNSVLFSFYSLNTVAMVNALTGTTITHFGQAVPNGLAFDPPETVVKWQHGTHFTDAGTVLTSTQTNGFGSQLWVREYEMDIKNGTMTEIFGFTSNSQVSAHNGSYAGEAHRLGNGNTLHNFGSGKRLREISADGNVVWEMSWGGSRMLGRTEFITHEDMRNMLEPEK